LGTNLFEAVFLYVLALMAPSIYFEAKKIVYRISCFQPRI